MNPDDDGAAMSEVEIASELYVGAMQEVCDAVEEYFRAQAEEIELSAAEKAGEMLADAFFRYEARRDELRAASDEVAP